MKTIVSMFALFVALCCMAQGKVVNEDRERLIKDLSSGEATVALKQEYVKCATDHANPFEWENQTYWAQNWMVAALFFDLNRDGRCDALVATPDQDLGHGDYAWVPMTVRADGRMSTSNDINDHESVECRGDSVYVATLSSGAKILVGCGATVEKYVLTERVWRKSGDIRFKLDRQGRAKPEFLKNGIADVVRNPDFKRLEKYIPEWYVGYDLKLRPKGRYEIVGLKERLPKAELDAPKEFQSCVRNYRDEVKRRLGLSRKVTVYAVFFDADKDGDADCYVTTDADKIGKDRYRWTLHVNDGGSFRKASGRIWFKWDRLVDVAALEPEDVAARNSFYELSRVCGDRQIQIFEMGSEGMYSHAYRNLLSDAERARRPSVSMYKLDEESRAQWSRRMEWEGEMLDKHGYFPPKDFREQVLGAYRIERLPCVEFKEE